MNLFKTSARDVKIMFSFPASIYSSFALWNAKTDVYLNFSWLKSSPRDEVPLLLFRGCARVKDVISNLFPVDARLTKAWHFESAGEKAIGPTLGVFK